MKNRKVPIRDLQRSLFSELKVREPRMLMPPKDAIDYPLTGCAQCVHQEACGGLDQNAAWGCFTSCTSSCDGEKCDYTCPARQKQFIQRCNEVGGLEKMDYNYVNVPSIESLPRYIPIIQSGSCRERPLDTPIVALPLRKIVRGNKGGSYGAYSQNAEALRARFLISPHTQVLIISVSTDYHIERYWRYAKLYHIPEQIAQLDTVGMTIPNFSYFTDAPRTDILYNRRRGMIAADALSAAGVGVIPHLNALTRGDWTFWERLLRDQAHIRLVSKEFQTGHSVHESGRIAIEELARLQDVVGRELHPILVGAGRFLPEVARLFKHYTIIDTRPYMETVYRRRFVAKQDYDYSWILSPTERREPLDDLLRHNLASYSHFISSKSDRDR